MKNIFIILILGILNLEERVEAKPCYGLNECLKPPPFALDLSVIRHFKDCFGRKIHIIGDEDKPKMKAWSAHEQDTALSCCRTLHVKHAAYASALYTLNISILVVLLYSWRIGVNAKRFKELDDVYYGVQIAYFAIIGTQMFMIVLSIFLFYGIYKENVAFLVPWVVGCMTCMALEAMAMVYSNILRDHVNKQFDAICKAEISFLIPRIIMNCVCIYCVLRLYHLLRAGVTWKGSAAIEL